MNIKPLLSSPRLFYLLNDKSVQHNLINFHASPKKIVAYLFIFMLVTFVQMSFLFLFLFGLKSNQAVVNKNQMHIIQQVKKLFQNNYLSGFVLFEPLGMMRCFMFTVSRTETTNRHGDKELIPKFIVQIRVPQSRELIGLILHLLKSGSTE